MKITRLIFQKKKSPKGSVLSVPFVHSYFKFHFCPLSSSVPLLRMVSGARNFTSFHSVSRRQPYLYPRTVTHRHSLFFHCPTPCFSIPSSRVFLLVLTSFFFPYRRVNSRAISNSVFICFFFRPTTDLIIGCAWTSRSLRVDYAVETVLTREKCTVIHLNVHHRMLHYNTHPKWPGRGHCVVSLGKTLSVSLT